MNLEVLNKILQSKKLTIEDHIKFNKIIDVLNALFIDEHKQSVLKVGYKVNDKQHIWFPNIILDTKKQAAIDEGYGNFISDDWDYIYQYNAQKDTNKRIKDVKKIKNIEYITFAKFNDKTKGLGYQFIGILNMTQTKMQSIKL